MKRMIIKPEGWKCKLYECPPGFFVFNDHLCFKTEYGPDLEVFNEGGEYFWGGVKTKEERAELEVQPVEVLWDEFD